MPLSLPDIDPRKEVARRVFDAFVAQIPVIGGPAAAVWSVTHPSEAQKQLAKWTGDVTSAIGDIEALLEELRPTIRLSENALALAIWLSRNSEQGRPREPIVFERLAAAFQDASKRELEDTCGELASYGLATTSAAIGHPIRRVSPTLELFVAFDPIAINTDPRRDAAQIARLICADPPPMADSLAEQLGWTARRLNPAMLVVASFIDDRRQSKEVHPEYACRYMIPDPTERARLMRFSDSVL